MWGAVQGRVRGHCRVVRGHPPSIRTIAELANGRVTGCSVAAARRGSGTGAEEPCLRELSPVNLRLPLPILVILKKNSILLHSISAEAVTMVPFKPQRRQMVKWCYLGYCWMSDCSFVSALINLMGIRWYNDLWLQHTQTMWLSTNCTWKCRWQSRKAEKNNCPQLSISTGWPAS